MPLLIRVTHCFETGLVFLEGGLGLMLYVLKLFHLFQQILSGLVVNVDSMLDHLGRGFESYRLSHQFFLQSFRLKRLDISSKYDIKAENSSTLCTFHEGRKGLRPMGSNADLVYASMMSP